MPFSNPILQLYIATLLGVQR